MIVLCSFVPKFSLYRKNREFMRDMWVKSRTFTKDPESYHDSVVV